jgi:two-component system, NarL family, nitrate/nitrite response regulator NarL
MRCIRILVADRHPVILQGLSSVLEAQRDFKIVARCGDGTTCIEAIRTFQPDITIVGMSMPNISGLEVLAIANCESLSTRVVFFASVEALDLQTLLAAGAYAVVPQDVDLETLVQTLRRVADYRRPLSAEQVVRQEPNAIAEKSVTALTDRERQIMRLVSEGLSNKEIGRRLNLTDGTIKVHLHHIFQKLEVGNRTALAAFAMSRNDQSDSSLEDLQATASGKPPSDR